MKRFLLSLMLALGVFALYNIDDAEAFVAPLQQNPDSSGSQVMLYDEQNLAMQYCKLDIRPASSYYAVTAEIAVKNNGADTSAMFGIPYYFYNGLSAASNVVVNYKGSSLKVTKQSAVKNSELDENQLFYDSYYCWTADISEGETAYMYITFTVSTRSYENNMQCIDIPLKVLRFWAVDSGYFELIVDSSAVNVYSFDRTPSIRPSEVLPNGVLKWEFSISLINSNLSAYYNIDNSVLYKFFTNTYTEGAKKQAADLFRTRQYDAVLSLIEEENLSEDINFKFMKMVCFEKLGMIEDAKQILDSIYNKEVCFSANNLYDISEYVRKRMLYNYYSGIKNDSPEMAVFKRDILQQGINALTDSKSSVFITWAKNEIKSLDVIINAEKDDVDNTEHSGNLTPVTWFEQISQPVIIAVGIIIVVVVLFCVAGMLSGAKKDKKVKTRNFKR